MRRRRRGGRRRRKSGRPQQLNGEAQQPGQTAPAAPSEGQPETGAIPVEQAEGAPQHQQARPHHQPHREHVAPAAVADEHRARAASEQPSLGTIWCAIVSVSDTRNARTDVSGRTIRQHLSVEPYRIKTTSIVKDEPGDIRRTVLDLLGDEEVRVIILTGGTGIGARDRTIEVLHNFFEKELPGFGEIFRQLSYQEIGSAAILSRAAAGIARRKLIVSLPGSPQAVRLALEKILLPELPHILDQLRR